MGRYASRYDVDNDIQVKRFFVAKIGDKYCSGYRALVRIEQARQYTSIGPARAALSRSLANGRGDRVVEEYVYRLDGVYVHQQVK